ncbi:MAG: RecX family transcriptional regulator [Thermotoga sp.]|nr:MAG: RecX family transcriptional regulator [Thermotoga sp.]
MKRSKKIDPMKYALKLLKIRARSEEEIRKRLRMKGYTEAEIGKVMEKLRRMNMVDDSKFSYLYAYDRLTVHKRGPKLIRMELIKLGVDERIVDDAIERVLMETKEEDVISGMVEKWKNLDKGKIIDRLMRRGFDYQKIVEVLNSLFEKEN